MLKANANGITHNTTKTLNTWIGIKHLVDTHKQFAHQDILNIWIDIKEPDAFNHSIK